jgi:hypothetical protein
MNEPFREAQVIRSAFDAWLRDNELDDDGIFGADEMERAFESGYRTHAELAAQQPQDVP